MQLLKPKVILIEPAPPRRHVFSAARLPRLGMVGMATTLVRQGYEAGVWCQAWAMPSLFELLTADLVGIGMTTSTAPEGYRLARLLRRHRVPVVLGGPHVSFLPEEGLWHADYVVRGEADRTFPALVGALLRGEGDPRAVPGTSYLAGEAAVHNPPESCPVDLDELPVPDLTLVRGSWRLTGRTWPVMTSRGCPHGCTFCGVAAMFGRRYRFRSTELVVEELRRLRGRRVFFYDDNFMADRERTGELLEMMLERGALLRSWSCQARADAARDRELLALMSRAGCRRVCVGFESINPATLAALHKHQDLDGMRSAIRAFHEAGIGVYGMFMLGADDDGPGTAERTVAFAVEERLEGAQFMILTPLPGTPFYAGLQRQGRLITQDWSLYDGQHAVFKPAAMEPAALRAAVLRAHSEFYSLRAAGDALLRGAPRAAWERTAARVLLAGWLRERRRAIAVDKPGGTAARLQLDLLDRGALRRLVREVKQTVRAGRLNLEIQLATPLHVASEKALARFVHLLDRMARLPGVRIRLTGLTEHMENLMLRVAQLVPAFEWSPAVSGGRQPNGGR